LARGKNSVGSNKTPEEELDYYKKEIGKQYMDGLISDKEYEDLLEKKRQKLDLGIAPSTDEATDVPECPTCGAHINPQDIECGICGSKLEPALEVEEAEAPPIEEEMNKICGTCGSYASKVDTICSICGGMFATEEDVLETPEAGEVIEIPIPEPEEMQPEETPEPAIAAEEKVCPSCGAFAEPDATECIICETPIVAIAVTEIKADISEPEEVILEPMAEEEPVPEPEIEEPIPEETLTPEIAEEIVCPSCGAFAEPDATECIICDAPMDAVVAEIQDVTIEEPTAEEQPVPEPEETVPEEPSVPESDIAEEKVCPSCGAFAEPDATECIICDTSFEEEVSEEILEVSIKPEISEPEAMPSNEDIDMLPADEEVPEEEPIPEDILQIDTEITCPSCSKAISLDSETCPECWTDLSLYVKCPSCFLLSPAGEKLCRECFAPLGGLEDIEPEIELGIDDTTLMELDIPDEFVISEELQEEMTLIETQEEQGKECLVCGAIFGPEDMLCPICGIEYGVEVPEPEITEATWEVLEVDIPPTIRTCPNCGANVTGLDATEREVDEGKWFYRGLIAIFSGVFFTSFSIWARGISAENSSLGLHPPPTDVVLNIFGWVLVGIGALFWFMSWRLHDERVECPECGIETEPDMENCINCGVELAEPTEEDMYSEDEQVDEDLLPKEDTSYLDNIDLSNKYRPEPEVVEQDIAELPEIEDITEEPAQEIVQEGIPEDIMQEITQEDIPEDIIQEIAQEDFVQEIEAQEPAVTAEPEIQSIEAPPEEHFPGEELPVEHEEHKKCPGCGIFIDLGDSICPVCDTEFALEPVVEILSEEEEMAGIEPEPSIDNAMIPDASSPHVECPSCGADVEAGTKQCPVCEYPLDGL